MSLNLNHLNPNQREAVLHGEGPLLVLAGAGSGKTSTMAHRIAHLITARNVSPGSILGLSFTNKAAGELKERVGKLVRKAAGRSATRDLTVTTFHSLCVRILRKHGEKLGFQSNFTIVDQSDQKDILKEIFRNIKIDDRKFDLDSILFQIGRAKSLFLKPEEAEAHFLESGSLVGDYAIAAASSFPKYLGHLRAMNAMDFDDLLYYGVKLLEDHEDVRDFYNWHFRHILVDEYQDTNHAQFRLLKLLTQKHQNLCVVGDDDQSIYAWRGADPSHILEFNRHYPAATVVTLDQNYRSTSTILDAANEVISKNKVRHPKKLWSDRGEGEPLKETILEEDREEAKFVAEEIFRIAKEHTRPWKDFAILYRSNSQSRVFEESLRMLRVPYRIVGGYSFLDRKEVKDVLSYWRIVLNPKDDASVRRVVNWPARGIGKSSLEALGTHAFQQSRSIFDCLEDASSIAPRAAAGASAFHRLIQGLKVELEAIPFTTPPELVQSVVLWARGSLQKIQAQKAVEEESDDPVQAARKWENVEELIHAIGQMQTREGEEQPQDAPALLRDFMSRMTLEKQDDEEEEDDRDGVTLLTLHGAKGLEYPVVFLVGMEEGFLPHKRTIEEATDFGEERRLCYVGITRAKDHLYLTRAKNRIRYGKSVPRNRSRFLDEIPETLLVKKDESLVPDHSSKQAQEEHESRVKNYLAEIRGRLGQ